MNKDITDEQLDRCLEAIKQREAEADNVPNPYDMFTETLILELKERGRLLVDARRLIEPFEWIDGRECAWCHADSRRTSGRPDAMGTPQDHKSRDNHAKGSDSRPPCRWLAFMKATESLEQKTEVA